MEESINVEDIPLPGEVFQEKTTENVNLAEVCDLNKDKLIDDVLQKDDDALENKAEVNKIENNIVAESYTYVDLAKDSTETNQIITDTAAPVENCENSDEPVNTLKSSENVLSFVGNDVELVDTKSEKTNIDDSVTELVTDIVTEVESQIEEDIELQGTSDGSFTLRLEISDNGDETNEEENNDENNSEENNVEENNSEDDSGEQAVETDTVEMLKEIVEQTVVKEVQNLKLEVDNSSLDVKLESNQKNNGTEQTVQHLHDDIESELAKLNASANDIQETDEPDIDTQTETSETITKDNVEETNQITTENKPQKTEMPELLSENVSDLQENLVMEVEEITEMEPNSESFCENMIITEPDDTIQENVKDEAKENLIIHEEVMQQEYLPPKEETQNKVTIQIEGNVVIEAQENVVIEAQENIILPTDENLITFVTEPLNEIINPEHQLETVSSVYVTVSEPNLVPHVATPVVQNEYKTIQITDKLDTVEANSVKNNEEVSEPTESAAETSASQSNPETTQPNPTTNTIQESKKQNAQAPQDITVKKGVPSAKKVTKVKEEFTIPCFVYGRNIDNPQEDLVSRGRTPPKPRLGVKVPYRNLKSEIVSKQEIANELLERAAKRNPVPDPPLGGDIFFAKKLTQNLAKKIAMKESKMKQDANNPSKEDSTSSTNQPEKINDNSDLLAILEGGVEVDLAQEIQKTSVPGIPKLEQTRPLVPEKTPPVTVPTTRIQSSKVLDPELERKLALQQLNELPRPLRGRRKQNLQVQVVQRQNLAKDIEVSSEITDPLHIPTPSEQTSNEKGNTLAIQESKPEGKIVTSTPNLKKKQIKNVKQEKTDKKVEDEPVVFTKRVMKTYSRKEALLEVPEDLAKIVDETEPTENAENKPTEEVNNKQEPSNETRTKSFRRTKSSLANINKPEVNLVSKRARIIKKKVIWDPDEVPNRKTSSPIKKTDEEIKSAKGKSVSKKVDKNKPTEKGDIKKVPSKSNKTAETQKPSVAEKKVVKILTKPKVLSLRAGTKKLLLKSKSKTIVSKSSNGEIKRSLTIINKNKRKFLKKRGKSKMTELDRLLMDEGAVNMLYNVKQQETRRKKIISLDRAHKDLQNRTKAVKEVIFSSTQEDSPKSLRKKDTPTPIVIRKKSRDSIRSSIQSPPPSPSYYSTRAEASRIIRRHSSSFSSDCSDTPRRMSVDQNAEKTENKQETTEEKKESTDTQQPVQQPTQKRKKGVPIFIRKANERTYRGKRKTSSEAENKEGENTHKSTTKQSEQTEGKTPQKSTTDTSKVFPKKRTRSSKTEENEPEGKSPIKSPPAKMSKKNDQFSELVKDIEKPNESEKRVSNRQIAMANNYKEISIRKIDNLVQIILTPTTTKIKNAVNLQMFHELCEVFTKLSKDDTCRVVLVSSTDNYFCHGLDFSTLIQTNAEKRLTVAQEMAKAVKEFFFTLAHFPKPLIAGVQGPAVGLGVTMLPLFDLVLASDKATFITPYGRLGHVPEGAIFLTAPHVRGSILTSELLFACRKLTASEALQHGLVTRVLWPDKFLEELIPFAKTIAKQSSQCMVATKSLLRQSLLTNLEATLDIESKLLVEHWISPECQQNFKKMLQENEWW